MNQPAATPAVTDRCPRCGGGFHCGMADAGPCACTTVTLDATTQATLRERYSGCLCLPCLVELSRPGDPLEPGACGQASGLPHRRDLPAG